VEFKIKPRTFRLRVTLAEMEELQNTGKLNQEFKFGSLYAWDIYLSFAKTLDSFQIKNHFGNQQFLIALTPQSVKKLISAKSKADAEIELVPCFDGELRLSQPAQSIILEIDLFSLKEKKK